MVIELANGGDGYIPPPEQHVVGGYNTWAARSAGLEVQAEPKITEALLQALENVADKPRREHNPTEGLAAKAVLDAKPAAYWRMDELALPRAIDISGNQRDGQFEDGVLFHLEGARSDYFNTDGETNRAAHFCGGRMTARIGGLGESYSVAMWIWNGMPDGARDIAGWMFSRGRAHVLDPHGDHLGLRGDGTLIYQHGDDAESAAAGATKIKRWTWTQVVLVRDGDEVKIYLNGSDKPEIEVKAPANFPTPYEEVFVGGRCDKADTWEGRLDEVAIFDRALTAEEVAGLAIK
ncbi:MAG: LamG domain-containing protein, partial [Verrucomicrobiota bacterium]